VIAGDNHGPIYLNRGRTRIDNSGVNNYDRDWWRLALRNAYWR